MACEVQSKQGGEEGRETSKTLLSGEEAAITSGKKSEQNKDFRLLLKQSLELWISGIQGIKMRPGQCLGFWLLPRG
jgi:hypothetical protein